MSSGLAMVTKKRGVVYGYRIEFDMSISTMAATLDERPLSDIWMVSEFLGPEA